MTPTFKALTPAGEWVEGYRYDLWNPIQGNRIPVIDKSDRFDKDGDSIAVVEVFPETVCMSTGLTDKNGKMIYEGDELELDGMKMFVDWFDGGFHLGRNENQTRSHVSQDRIRKFTLTGKNIKTEGK